uniref:Uncharacterized protein n=1 Tax=Anguilla anguilla TaxID=7936 RepID=A0A0E9RYD8_ANGAN
MAFWVCLHFANMCIRICITVPFRLESLGCAGPPSPTSKCEIFRLHD